MKYEAIPCKHETHNYHSSVRLDDYYPLTKEQIFELLDESLTSDNPSSQQVRLIQAIPGIKCPREIDNNVAKKETMLCKYFIAGLNRKRWTDFEKYKINVICGGKKNLLSEIKFLFSGNE